MGTKKKPGDFDCYTRAEPDEPMFVLLARDENAPTLVRQWVHDRAVRKNEKVGGIVSLDLKAIEALNCADEMEAWREAHPDI